MRRKVKTFFHVFTGSLFPQPSYYHKIPKASFGFSLKYFISLTFILNFILASALFVRFNPKKINRLIDGFVTGLDRVPNNFTVTVRNGYLFSNYNRPYFFWVGEENKKKLFLVVDETASPEKINIYNTYILLTNRELVFKTNYQPGNSYQTIALKSIDGQTLSKNGLKKISNSLLTIQKLFFVFYLLAVPFLYLFLPAVSLVITSFYLAIISLIVYLIFKTYYHKHLHYKKTLQLSFHAVTLPLLIDYFLIIFKPSVPTNLRLNFFIPAPLAFLILLSMFVFAAVYEAYQNGKLHTPHHPHPSKKHNKS